MSGTTIDDVVKRLSATDIGTNTLEINPTGTAVACLQYCDYDH